MANSERSVVTGLRLRGGGCAMSMMSDRRCLTTLQGHSGCVNGVACFALADGAPRAISASNDKTLRVWDPLAGTCLRTLQGHTSFVYSVCALGDARLASGSYDKTVRVWDAATGACALTLQGHTNWVRSVCALGDGRLASGSADHTVRLRVVGELW